MKEPILKPRLYLSSLNTSGQCFNETTEQYMPLTSAHTALEALTDCALHADAQMWHSSSIHNVTDGLLETA